MGSGSSAGQDIISRDIGYRQRILAFWASVAYSYHGDFAMKFKHLFFAIFKHISGWLLN